MFKAEPKTRAQDTPETPPPTISTSYIIYWFLVLSSIILDILKIIRIKIAQKEATTPISFTTLSPFEILSKSSKVILKMINAKAIKIRMYVKIFMVKINLGVKIIKNIQTDKPLTLGLNILTTGEIRFVLRQNLTSVYQN